MKQKAIRIALGLLVVLTWGAVLKRAVHKPEVVAPQPLQMHARTASDSSVTIGAVHLVLDRDPFLDSKQERTTPRTSQRTATTHTNTLGYSKPKTLPATPPPIDIWPTVEYNGLVSNTGSPKERVGFIRVNGKAEMTALNAITSGLVVQELRVDSVLLDRSGDKRWFRRM